MVKALARAFRWRNMLDEGVHTTLEDLAKAKRLAPSYVSGILRLTLLAPEIVEVILDGRQPAALQLDDLLKGFPLDWEVKLRQSGMALDCFAISKVAGHIGRQSRATEGAAAADGRSAARRPIRL
jgi:hypothetical protein